MPLALRVFGQQATTYSYCQTSYLIMTVFETFLALILILLSSLSAGSLGTGHTNLLLQHFTLGDLLVCNNL